MLEWLFLENIKRPPNDENINVCVKFQRSAVSICFNIFFLNIQNIPRQTMKDPNDFYVEFLAPRGVSYHALKYMADCKWGAYFLISKAHGRGAKSTLRRSIHITQYLTTVAASYCGTAILWTRVMRVDSCSKKINFISYLWINCLRPKNYLNNKSLLINARCLIVFFSNPY